MNKISFSGGDQFIETRHTLVKLSANPAYEQVAVWDHFNARLYQSIRGRVEDEGGPRTMESGTPRGMLTASGWYPGEPRNQYLTAGKKFCTILIRISKSYYLAIYHAQRR